MIDKLFEITIEQFEPNLFSDSSIDDQRLAKNVELICLSYLSINNINYLVI